MPMIIQFHGVPGNRRQLTILMNISIIPKLLMINQLHCVARNGRQLMILLMMISIVIKLLVITQLHGEEGNER